MRTWSSLSGKITASAGQITAVELDGPYRDLREDCCDPRRVGGRLRLDACPSRPKMKRQLTKRFGERDTLGNYAVILAAAGKSSRYKDTNYKKPFAPLEGRAVWLHSAERLVGRDDVKQVIVVISAEDQDFFDAKYGANLAFMGIEVALGGDSRAESVRNGLAKVRDDIDFVAVHDAARPVFTDAWIDAVFSTAAKRGAAILATPVTSTIKRVEDGRVAETVDRDQLWEAQTPQVFRREWLLEAYQLPQVETATDDAELVQRLGHHVAIVAASPLNLKITTRDDMKMAALALKALPKPKLNDKPGNPLDDMWR